MNGYEYAVTVKKTRSPVSSEHYFNYLNWLAQFGDVANVNFETTRGLHVHFIFRSKERMLKRSWKYAGFGWSINFVEIYDRQGWVNYCEKDLRVRLAHVLIPKRKLF